MLELEALVSSTASQWFSSVTGCADGTAAGSDTKGHERARLSRQAIEVQYAAQATPVPVLRDAVHMIRSMIWTACLSSRANSGGDLSQ